MRVSLHFERKGVARLAVEGHSLDSIEVPRTWPVNVLTSGMNCGRDGTAPVSDAYLPPFAFTGSNLRVLFELGTAGNVEPGGH